MTDSTLSKMTTSVAGYAALRLHFGRVLIVFSLFNSVIGIFAAASTVGINSNGILISVAYVGASLLALYFSMRGWSRGVMVTLLITYLAATLLIPDALLLNATLAVVAGAMLASSLLYWVVTLGVCAQFVLLTINQANNRAAGAPFDLGFVTMMLSIIVVSVTTRFLANRFEAVAERSQASANLLQAAAATGEIIGKLLKLDEILPQAVELIRERFAFYHVQIFLLDETGENAQLAASTGSVGQLLFERRHSLPVGSRSVIGRVTSTMQPVTANDTDSFYHRNELLPYTRSELALPILDGDKIIGALDDLTNPFR